jgi:NAD+ kinase
VAVSGHHPATSTTLKRCRKWAAANRVELWDALVEAPDDLAAEMDSTDLLVVLGGDGTFLRAARAVGDSGVPILGINLGRVGFLAQVEPATLEQALDAWLADAYTIGERLRLEATIERADGSRESQPCLNDVVVARGERVRLIELDVEVGGSHLATWLADGVVVATPTGSTAYAFSAGGPILDPRLRNLVIAPIAAYLSALRSVVAGEDHTVRITLREARHGAVVSLDGQWDYPLQPGEAVVVRALSVPLRLIEPAGRPTFYDLLRTKASLLPS